MKVYACIPSCRDWKPHFGSSLCGLVRQMTLDSVDFIINAMMGTSVLPKARQLALEHAIQEGFTHVLFLDDDMSFGPDLFRTLANPGEAVVGANYSNKSAQRNPQTHSLEGQPVSSNGQTGCQEVGWIGFGAVLIELAALAEVPKPWFEMRWMEDRQSFIGEDYYFCGKLRAHGVKIHVHHDAHCGHVGDIVYREAA